MPSQPFDANEKMVPPQTSLGRIFGILLSRASLSGIACCWLTFETYLHFRYPSPELPVYELAALEALTASMFLAAFGEFRAALNRSPARQQPYAGVHKSVGVQVIVFGAFFLVGAVILMVCQLWDENEWPSASAVLVGKEFQRSGVLLTFDYQIDSRAFTSTAVRMGSEKSLHAALQAFKPGSIQTIRFDPFDPSRIELVASDGWWGAGRLAARILIFSGVLGAFMIRYGLKLCRNC